MFYLNSTLNFGIPLVLVFQLEVCCKVDRLLTGITAQQKGTTARWFSNKTSLWLIIKWRYRKACCLFYFREMDFSQGVTTQNPTDQMMFTTTTTTTDCLIFHSSSSQEEHSTESRNYQTNVNFGISLDKDLSTFYNFLLMHYPLINKLIKWIVC